MQIFTHASFDPFHSQNYIKYCSIMQSYLQLSEDYNRISAQNQKLKQLVEEVDNKTSQIKSLLDKSDSDQVNLFSGVQRQMLGKETNRDESENNVQRGEISEIAKRNRKRIRKPSQRRYKCPFRECGKLYDTSVSLNLHMKLKHNAGTKKERESLAESILLAMQRGEAVPVAGIELPPEYLEEYKIKKAFKQKYSM